MEGPRTAVVGDSEGLLIKIVNGKCYICSKCCKGIKVPFQV